MRSIERQQSAFRAPWDTILGVESHVRTLRVLDESSEPMSTRELARRTGVQLRAVQLTVGRLEAAGVVERIGTGPRPQVRLRRSHPLAPALHDLFEVERERVRRVLEALKKAARAVPQLESVWLEGSVAEGLDENGDVATLGVLARSGDVDAAVDALRAAMSGLMSQEDLHIQVRGWTRADLMEPDKERVRALEEALPLLGAVPIAAGDRKRGSGPRTHAEADADLLRRGKRVSEVLAKRPELIAQARRDLARRLETAGPQEARTLREWLQLLDGLSAQRLRRFLTDPGEQATRLRQSLPLVFLRASGAVPGKEKA